MEITSNRMNEKHYSTSMVIKSNILNKYKTTYCIGIKTDKRYLRLEGPLVEIDYYQI